METESEEVLPKMMNGTVHAQYIRCGKANCKCSQGQLHGAYYYHFERVDGKLKKRYLKPSEVIQVQEACLLRQLTEKKESRTNQQTWIAFREVREQVRQLSDQIYNGD